MMKPNLNINFKDQYFIIAIVLLTVRDECDEKDHHSNKDQSYGDRKSYASTCGSTIMSRVTSIDTV